MLYVITGTAKGKSFKIPTSRHDKIYEYFQAIYGDIFHEQSGLPISIEIADWAEMADVGERYENTALALNCQVTAIPEWC